MPSPYLLWVNSRPLPDSGVDDDLWIKWYTTEHLPDLVNTKTSTRACFYRERLDYSEAAEKSPRKFLAVYQSDHEEPLKFPGYVNDVRHTSDLFPKEVNRETGEFNARNYKMVQDYDPNKIGEAAPPFMFTVEMDPIDEEDFNKWYREEHLEKVSKFPGYRRSNRYKIGPKTPLTLEEPPSYIAFHEMDDLKGLKGKERDAADDTPWTQKSIKNSRHLIMRVWELIHSEGPWK